MVRNIVTNSVEGGEEQMPHMISDKPLKCDMPRFFCPVKQRYSQVYGGTSMK
jgi:hypothetical protein